MIGMHVWSEYFNKGKRPVEFVRFQPSHLAIRSTVVLDRMVMVKYAIEVREAKVTEGEWSLLRDKQLCKYRCRPSPLRKSWSTI